MGIIAAEEEGVNVDEDENKDVLFKQFSDGRCYILPSFYQMMMYLKRKNKDFAIIFRSYGEDSEKVINEFNRFCLGTHPCYNGKHNQQQAKFDGTKKNRDYQISKMKKGIMYRKSKNIEDAILILGTLEKINNPKGDLEEQYQQKGLGHVRIYRGSAKIHLAIMESLRDSCSLFIKDDYEPWIKHGKQTTFGKPLIVD